MRIAIVNDTPQAMEVLIGFIRATRAHELAWGADNATTAISLCDVDPPDLIVMDLGMSGVKAVEAIRQIMQCHPCPILIVTDSVQQNYDTVFEAMGAGAIDVLSTPDLYNGKSVQVAELLLQKIALLGFFRKPTRCSSSYSEWEFRDEAQDPKYLIVIGCSSGGPAAVAKLLAKLPSEFLAPIVVIQHIDAQFARPLASWLDEKTALKVKTATESELLRPGHVYVAAKDKHLMMNRDCRLYYSVEPHETYYRPSVDVFFQSVATHWYYPVTAILLTGMGADGAYGLLKLRRAGAYTVAQDEQTSAVYGMPKVAADMGAAVDVLSLSDISTLLRESALEKAEYCKSRLSGGVEKIP